MSALHILWKPNFLYLSAVLRQETQRPERGATRSRNTVFGERTFWYREKKSNCQNKSYPEIKKRNIIPCFLFFSSFLRFGWRPKYSSSGSEDDEGWVRHEDHSEPGEGEWPSSSDASQLLKPRPSSVSSSTTCYRGYGRLHGWSLFGKHYMKSF